MFHGSAAKEIFFNAERCSWCGVRDYTPLRSLLMRLEREMFP